MTVKELKDYLETVDGSMELSFRVSTSYGSLSSGYKYAKLIDIEDYEIDSELQLNLEVKT